MEEVEWNSMLCRAIANTLIDGCTLMSTRYDPQLGGVIACLCIPMNRPAQYQQIRILSQVCGRLCSYSNNPTLPAGRGVRVYVRDLARRGQQQTRVLCDELYFQQKCVGEGGGLGWVIYPSPNSRETQYNETTRPAVAVARRHPGEQMSRCRGQCTLYVTAYLVRNSVPCM